MSSTAALFEGLSRNFEGWLALNGYATLAQDLDSYDDPKYRKSVEQAGRRVAMGLLNYLSTPDAKWLIYPDWRGVHILTQLAAVIRRTCRYTDTPLPDWSQQRYDRLFNAHGRFIGSRVTG